MEARVDHLAIWVEDPLRTVDFFVRVLGFASERLEAYQAGKVLFPSIRLSAASVLDLMPLRAAPRMNELIAGDTAGHRINHLCLSFTKADFDELQARLAANAVPTPYRMKDWWGAQGQAPEALYFQDPDGNVFEARYYA